MYHAKIKVPAELDKTLYWFGHIIERPIDEYNQINPIAPSGEQLEIEAAEYIAPSPTLRPAERIQIYNQQYWWRLLNVLQEIFPLITVLKGYSAFNRKIAIPYLMKYPSTHWTVVFVGDRLTEWLEEYYNENDKELLVNSAKIDWAFNHSFIAAEFPSLTIADMETETISSQLLFTQPHLAFFEMNYNLFKFRKECLDHPIEYWKDHPLPALESQDKEKMFFVLYRNQYDDISWKQISIGEYYLLSRFQKGTTIDDACEWLESQEMTLVEAAMSNLQGWFQEWTARGWLVKK